MLTQEMKSIIATYPLGFVASVNRDGTPNLSPKGTFVVLDDRQLVFGHIRSPQTMGNIAERPQIEINFLDVLARKAVRVGGRAYMFTRNAPEFEALFAALSVWKGYTEIMKAVVRVDIEKAALILSPAYDIGHTEAQCANNTERNSHRFERSTDERDRAHRGATHRAFRTLRS